MPEIITFEDTSLEILTIENQPWLRGPQIGVVLGMANPAKAIRTIYRRHQKEFTEDMTTVMRLPTPGGPQLTWLFNARGAALLGLLSRTERGADFRRWVLDVLEARREQADITRAHRDAALKTLCRFKPEYGQVVRYVGVGLSNTEIARLVGKAPSTVRGYRKDLMAMGVLEPSAPAILEDRRHG